MNNYHDFINQNPYPTLSDLRYSEKFAAHLSASEITEFLNYKDSLISNRDTSFTSLDLNSFNSNHIFFANHSSLKDLYDEYFGLVNSDGVFDSNFEEMEKARIYSELEGSLNIEGYNSTRLIFDKLMSGKEPENENEIRIKNMANALSYIETAPAFNRDNLLKLYTLISDKCLKEDQKLKPSDYYRFDMVYISNYNGAPIEQVTSCMDSLFAFVNNGLKTNDPLFKFLLPHIAHYYIVYVHPYFDCNGRTARMVSLWIAKLSGIDNSAYFISEAINGSKKDYYHAISRTRDTRNDLTYFLLFILEASIKYALCYRKLNEYQATLAITGDSMTSAEYGYMKKILFSFEKQFFTRKDFVGKLGTEMTKQGALKALNKLEAYGLLESGVNKKGEKIFRTR